MIPSLGTNVAADTLPGGGQRQGRKARTNFEMDRVICPDAGRDDDDGLAQLEARDELHHGSPRPDPREHPKMPAGRNIGDPYDQIDRIGVRTRNFKRRHEDRATIIQAALNSSEPSLRGRCNSACGFLSHNQAAQSCGPSTTTCRL